MKSKIKKECTNCKRLQGRARRLADEALETADALRNARVQLAMVARELEQKKKDVARMGWEVRYAIDTFLLKMATTETREEKDEALKKFVDRLFGGHAPKNESDPYYYFKIAPPVDPP